MNEICSSNSSLVADEAGQFDDWIELLNSGNTAVNLQGWSIGKESNWAMVTKSLLMNPFS